MSKGNVNTEPVLAVVMRGKLLEGPPLVIQQCISHSLEALLLHHCYLFKVTETADPACFCVVKDYLQTRARSWIHNRSVSLRAAFVLGFVVFLCPFFWVVGLSCIYHAHVFPRFPASCWKHGEVYREGHISETLTLCSALKNVCTYCMCVCL